MRLKGRVRYHGRDTFRSSDLSGDHSPSSRISLSTDNSDARSIWRPSSASRFGIWHDRLLQFKITLNFKLFSGGLQLFRSRYLVLRKRGHELGNTYDISSDEVLFVKLLQRRLCPLAFRMNCHILFDHAPHHCVRLDLLHWVPAMGALRGTGHPIREATAAERVQTGHQTHRLMHDFVADSAIELLPHLIYLRRLHFICFFFLHFFRSLCVCLLSRQLARWRRLRLGQVPEHDEDETNLV